MDSGIGEETKSEEEKIAAMFGEGTQCMYERERVRVCVRERECVCECEREILIELKSGRGGEWSTEALDFLTFTYTNLCVQEKTSVGICHFSCSENPF